jgi:S1-C subfamily serine protease
MSAIDSSQPNLSTLSDQFADAIASAGQAIVAINVEHCGTSGVYWQDGIIVTVEHAIHRDEEVTITLADGRTTTATVVGQDNSTDLAVLRLSESGLPTPPLSMAPLRVGQLVLAAGRSGSNLIASMGMIGRFGGSWRSWQGGEIDQLIRPVLISSWGLAGSILLDSQGQMIGINTQGPRHMTLTLPNTTIQRVVNQLLQTGRIARGYLGIGMQTIPISERLVESLKLSDAEGVMLLSVEAGSPADQAGLLIGDVLIALDAQPITDVGDVRLMLTPERVGQSLTARLIRGGSIVEVMVTVGERSEPEEPSDEPRRRGRGRGRGRR